ncbi:MAG: hypothetical protein IPP71_19195 [Bacteroidetes bacterium]|nr:hypothetical protein [Bacteroidota bacterium]
MEFINRSVVKWVFIAVVAITFAIQISDAFSQDRIKQGYPAIAASEYKRLRL